MEGFDPKTSFGDQTSRRYDTLETRGDEDDTVAFLAALAARGDALEFAIGTGRIALPLTRAGVHVEGIEQSQHMVDRMREKPGGDVTADAVTLDVARYDPVTQLLDENHVYIGADEVRLGPICVRLAHPPESDGEDRGTAIARSLRGLAR